MELRHSPRKDGELILILSQFVPLWSLSVSSVGLAMDRCMWPMSQAEDFLLRRLWDEMEIVRTSSSFA